MSTFAIGDTVTLTRAVARAFMGRRSIIRREDKSFTWHQRKGVVVRVQRNKTIGVRWEGRTGVDPLPPRALVRCTDSAT